jgi:hypothetical protein
MPPNGFVNEEDEQEKLSQDYSPPFSPPSGIQDSTDDTHPEGDTNIDSHEHYDEGISGAEEVEDRGNRGVLGYDPSRSISQNDKPDKGDD